MKDLALRKAVAAQARAIGVEPAALMAIVSTESAGRTSALVNGREEPLIRFEGHYFYRLLKGAARARAVREGLASPRAGAVANPRSQAGRWKLLARARAIDRDAADCSVSWGLGQVMGENWRKLGYTSVEALVADARSGVAGQVRLMVRFVRANGLDRALRAKNWRAFARAYNGPAYARNDYDGKMARAYARYRRQGMNAMNALTGSSSEADMPADTGPAAPPDRPQWWDVTGTHPTLAVGARGPAVARCQEALGLHADGLYGPATREAVKAFQAKHGLGADGMVGPDTWAAIDRLAAPADASRTDGEAHAATETDGGDARDRDDAQLETAPSSPPPPPAPADPAAPPAPSPTSPPAPSASARAADEGADEAKPHADPPASTTDGGDVGKPTRWYDVTGDRPVLGVGARGEAVRRVQERLMVDGLYGPLTRDAVRRFQTTHGLKADGMVGPDTWTALDRVTARDATPAVGRLADVLDALARFVRMVVARLRKG